MPVKLERKNIIYATFSLYFLITFSISRISIENIFVIIDLSVKIYPFHLLNVEDQDQQSDKDQSNQEVCIAMVKRNC